MGDARGRLLGAGLYNAASRIAIRLLSQHLEPFDEAFFERRLRVALRWRQRYVAGASCYRLVNSEADSLSGLIADCYEDMDVLRGQKTGLYLDQQSN